VPLRAVYRRTVVEARVRTKRYRLISRHVRENVTVLENMTVLDVGCGTGIFTVEMLRLGVTRKAGDCAPGCAFQLTPFYANILPATRCSTTSY
jgi:2-polyprenyl-3-methyl-5-hydroxy-6-metoxy-1,4-benzoquinol methylase